MPSDSEQLTAEMAIKDGVADTREELTAAGRASSADWSVGGRVEARGHYVRVEIEACQVSTGRVESLARNIEVSQERKKLGEMLALLLRPEGIANATIPWGVEAPPEPPREAPPVSKPPEPPPPPPEPKKTEPEAPPAPPRVYAQNKPFAIGAGVGALAAVGRPERASGPATTLAISGSFGYAIDAVPGLELRADVGGGVIAPRSFFFAGGARYAFMAAPRAGLYVGPEVEIGGFFPAGGDKEARFLVRGSPVVGLALADALSVEAFGDLIAAPGGTGALVLVGGGARALVRF